MEFHGTQFLPNGLPELIYQITPPVMELRPVEPGVVCPCGSDLVWTLGEGYSFEEKLCGACGYRFDVASGPRTCELLRRPKEQLRLPLRVRKTAVQRR